MDEIDLDASEMPTGDIDAHLRHLRSLHPTADPKIIEASSPRSKAVAPAYCALAHALADYIDVMRGNGYSVGEALRTIEQTLIEPMSDAPYIDTSS